VEQEMKLDWEDLAAGAGHWLELFDSAFAMDDVPLDARPLKSAMWLVKDAFSEFPPGASKTDYFDKEWFAAVVVAIKKWYEDRYGAEAFVPNRNPLSGLVSLHGTPVRLSIPETISEVETEGETAWLIFPDAIHKSETPLSFFQSKPNLNALLPEERVKVENRISQAVKSSRSTKLMLDFASDLPDEAKQMAVGLWGHVEKGVKDILSLKPAVAAVGCWELHLAVEKAFKVLAQQNGKKITGHDLEALSDKVKPFGCTVTPQLLQELPQWKKSIEYRYGEKEIAVNDAIKIYEAALSLVDEITSKLRRDLVINNAGLLLKKPRWVGRK
jgi:hypothetical protein